MNSLKIALLQIMPGNNIEENRRIGEEARRKAKLFDADIALFPEMWSCGYSFPENPAELEVCDFCIVVFFYVIYGITKKIMLWP